MKISRRYALLFWVAAAAAAAVLLLTVFSPGASTAVDDGAAENLPEPAVEYDCAQTASLQTAVDWAYLDEYRLSVELKITGLNSIYPYFNDCPFPVKNAVLSTSSGEVIGRLDYPMFYLDNDVNIYYFSRFEHSLDTVSGKPHKFFLDLVMGDDEQVRLPFEIQPSGGRTLFPAQVVSNNEVTAELISLEINQRTINFEICFDFPSSMDWMPRPYIEGHTTDSDGAALLSGSPWETTHLCWGFRLDNYQGFEISPDEDLTIRIDEIVTSTPELPSSELVEQANQRSELEGVRFKVVPGDHTYTVEIISKPAGMSDEDARTIAFESIPERIEGPWLFTISIP